MSETYFLQSLVQKLKNYWYKISYSFSPRPNKNWLKLIFTENVCSIVVNSKLKMNHGHPIRKKNLWPKLASLYTCPQRISYLIKMIADKVHFCFVEDFIKVMFLLFVMILVILHMALGY